MARFEINVCTGEVTEYTDAPSAEIISTIPKNISALQGLLAIHQFGLDSAYELWANDSTRTFVERAFINKAQTWDRNDVTLNSAATSLGLTTEQVDSMFLLAVTL